MKKLHLWTLPIALLATAALSLCERQTGTYGLAFSLCLAFLLCRVSPVIAVGAYAAMNGLVHFSLPYLAVVGAGVVIAASYVLFLWKTKRKYRIWANILLCAVAQTPAFVLLCPTTRSLMIAAVGLLVVSLLQFAFVATAYPVLVRGTRYGLTDGERVFCVVSAAPFFAGLAVFEPFGFKTVFFALALFCLLYERCVDRSAALVGIGGAFGAALIRSDPVYLLFGAAICLGVTLRRAHRYLGGVGAFGAYVVCLYLFGGAMTWQTLAPVGAAALVGFLPEKCFQAARLARESYRGRFALRTAANREREEVSGKLGQVSDALRKAQRILEGERKRRASPQDVADGVREACCLSCGKLAACKEKIGDARAYFLQAATSGMETGRVTYLDFDGKLGAVCVRLPRIIRTTSDYVKRYREELDKRTGAEQGRDMVIGTLGGTADLMDEVAATVNKGFGFDLEGEKRIREELACVDVIAGDAAIYDGGEKITLTVREGDERKKEIVRVVSEAAGRNMYPAERRAGVNGTVCLTYKRTPVFGVLYGEKSEAKERECGDAKEAIRIADDKVLFVLSDGMGTGAEARKTGLNAIALIETFYKAGFSHATVFGCVSKILALREKESFSALDVAILDTHTGEMDFIKQGGRESYLFSQSGVEKLSSEALPIGIVDECEPTYFRRRVKGNELVVMLSDGVADALTEADVTEIVGNLKTLNPQVIAEKIVLNAVKKSGGKKDDATAMVIRVVKNEG